MGGSGHEEVPFPASSRHATTDVVLLTSVGAAMAVVPTVVMDLAVAVRRYDARCGRRGAAASTASVGTDW